MSVLVGHPHVARPESRDGSRRFENSEYARFNAQTLDGGGEPAEAIIAILREPKRAGRRRD